MLKPASILFQTGKLGHINALVKEIDWAEAQLDTENLPGRVYGSSGGCLTAAAFALECSARLPGAGFEHARGCLRELRQFLQSPPGGKLHGRSLNPAYGPFNLHPLRKWLAGRLQTWTGKDNPRLSEIPVPTYLCAMDHDGTLTLFGPPNPDLQFHYAFVKIGPPQDAPLLDALIAGLSTVLSTAPGLVNGYWYRDCRPAIVDLGALVADLEAADPCPIRRVLPYAPLRRWPLNFITSSFLMHAHMERNQSLLAAYYLDLCEKHRRLEAQMRGLPGVPVDGGAPEIHHVQLPYIGSTEASTNMRQSVANKAALMARFSDILDGQLDSMPFHLPANIIYGAGGVSGIIAGLITTRAIEAGFQTGRGEIQQIYGVSAGVLNGFFHAVQVAARRHPDLYRPAAQSALADLEAFVAALTPAKITRFNWNPGRLWQGWYNLEPLELFLRERLSAYTGSRFPEQIHFDDIALPLTVTAARSDGFQDFLGMTAPERRMNLGGRTVQISPAPIIQSILAGWSMNTYIQPTVLNGEHYRDGGGPFYDIGLFAACLDAQLTNLINIHLDEPEDHSYHIPPRPNLVRIVFDTHNYSFPEERRRMLLLSNLLYAHFRLRREAAARLAALPPGTEPPFVLEPDFRQNWPVVHVERYEQDERFPQNHFSDDEDQTALRAG